MVKGDPHVHSLYSSGDMLKYDCPYSPKEMVEAGSKVGLEWMSFTEHNVLRFKEALEAGEKYEVTILPGVEMTFKTGRKFWFWDEQVHIIALGIEEGAPKKVVKGGMERFCRWVKEEGGMTVAPHTYWLAGVKNEAKEEYIDAIEIFNPQVNPLANLRAGLLCKEANKIPIPGSDSHSYETVGKVEVGVDASADPDDILQALKKGKVKIIKTEYNDFFQPYRTLVEKYKKNFDTALDYLNRRESHFERSFGRELFYSGINDKLRAKIFYALSAFGWHVEDTFYNLFGLIKDGLRPKI